MKARVTATNAVIATVGKKVRVAATIKATAILEMRRSLNQEPAWRI